MSCDMFPFVLAQLLIPLDRPVPCFPFVGHAPAFARDPLTLLTRLAVEQGGVAALRMGAHRGFVVSEPALVGEVLVTGKRRYSKRTLVYDAMREFLGLSHLTSEGDDWRIHRRIVQPAFHKRRLASFADDIARISEQALAGWTGQVDVSEQMMRLTLRVVSEVLLGTRTTDDAQAIGRAMDEAQRYTEAVMTSVVTLPAWVPTPRRLRFKKTLEVLDQVSYRIIDAKERSGERGDDVVSMLLDARYEDGSRLTRERLRNELVTLLAAGHETTSNALSWTLLRLSQHPEVARRLAREVDEVLGDRAPTFEDLPKLTYTRWVFDEAMRLHPPVWVTGRSVLEAHTLGGHRVDVGDLVLLTPWVTHRRADLWDNPEAFDPERWRALSARGALPAFTFYPFGGGTRKCIGEAFAYLEATIVLAMIAQRMRLSLVPGHPVVPSPQITLGFEHGLRMRVRPRAPAGLERSDAAQVGE